MTYQIKITRNGFYGTENSEYFQLRYIDNNWKRAELSDTIKRSGLDNFKNNNWLLLEGASLEDALILEIDKRVVGRKNQAIKLAEKQRTRDEEYFETYSKLLNDLKGTDGIIPSTLENIGIVLNYLNCKNWGGWKLPAMTIGYSAHQYDCDGINAATMQLDHPIICEEEEIYKFKVGGKFGHLTKYMTV